MPFVLIFTLLVITVFWVNSTKLYKAVYIFLNLALLILTFISFVFYTSTFSISPWYTPEGMPSLVIIYLTIWMLIIGGFLFLLSKRIYIPKNTIYITSITAIIMLANKCANTNWHLLGVIASLAMFVTIVVLFVKNFDRVLRK